MSLPTFTSAGWTTTGLLFQASAFVATVLYGSFFEWTLHRNVMHKKTWISFPFELHAMLHHKIFRWDETYHAQSEEMKEHVTFVPRDYIILLLVNTPVILAVEWAIHRPIAVGAWVAILCYLGMFDLLHWSFHVPKERVMERWFWVRWLKEHHRLHHQYQNRNLNVVFPLADFVFRTRISKPKDPQPIAPVPEEVAS